mgnify:CR=1 FL=1
MFADIIVDIQHEKLDKIFQYRIPEELESRLQPGMEVVVPFGKGNRQIKGYVTGFSEKCEYDLSKVKSILSISEKGMEIETRLIALAAWMKEHYGGTMIQSLKTVLPIRQKENAKVKKHLRLLLSEKEGEEKLAFYRKKNQKARARLLEALLADRLLDYELVTGKLNITLPVIRALEEQGVLKLESEQIYRNPVQQGTQQERTITFTSEQEQVIRGFREDYLAGKRKTYLIHGVTGSGKTEVYMEMIHTVVEHGRQAIVLIPEIALTYQTVMRFYRKFGDRVSIMNSRLSAGERYDQMMRAKRGEIDVMIGPRSALFTPFPNLGLVVIDEEHEPTYKSEQIPRYHARETAIYRAKMEGANVILGSATPSMEAYYRASTGEYALVKLEARYEERPLPQVSIVDMREQLKKGNRSALSMELKGALGQCLAKGEQAMLFLNRRGYAGFVSCRSCGHVMKCPHCDVSLSEHNGRKLICHYCGYETAKPDRCPVCSSPYIGGFKAGTQQIQQVVEKEFPEARVLRMDYDTTRAKGSYEEILEAFSQHRADILIGTQMIVKGHDFPDVTLVGVIAADLSLNADDYRSGERTFQLLTQAVGRSGRGKKEGHALIQTYSPDHYSIQTASRQDYEEFYEEEMGYRILMDYPPSAHMMAVLGASEDEAVLEAAMHYLRLFVDKLHSGKALHVIGPAPAPVGKVKDIYRRVIYLKHENYDLLVRIKDRLEEYIEINSGFRKVNIQFDFL